jgi:hypothetical protein
MGTDTVGLMGEAAVHENRQADEVFPFTGG